jgi:hypothetical protein
MRARRFFLIGLAAMLASGAPAWAIERCTTSCDQSFGGNCVTRRTHCENDSSAPTVTYGAIAFGRKSQAFGYSHGWDSQAKAESVAMQNCGKHGTDCEVMVWFERKCGAVAVRSNSTAVYWGLGNSAAEAQRIAMDQCTKNNGQQCEVKVSHCSK